MKAILDKVLEKRGITDITKLTPEEKETFDKWDKILSEGSITVSKISEFCENQISKIESSWRKDVIDNSSLKNEKFVIMHTVYTALLDCITGQKSEREELEKYLQSLLK